MAFSKSKSFETLVALSAVVSASAFNCISGRTPFQTCRAPFEVRSEPAAFLPHFGHTQTKFSLSALIFGWDGEDDEPDVSEVFNDGGMNSCKGTAASPVAAAVAERISNNKDSVGSLARLAVAFSPPERALTLKDIQQVQVLCVSETHIEIEAIICENGGCVNLHVPVSFPRECGSEMLEGCVLRNLDELDMEAEGVIRVTEETVSDDDLDLDDLCILNNKPEYPNWWVPRECDTALVTECDTIIRLLNEDDFKQDVKAMAQGGIRALRDGEQYEVQRAIVVDVGPAGILLRARAVFHYEEDKPVHTLDVLVPFGGPPMQNAASLRAAVLGAVAATQD